MTRPPWDEVAPAWREAFELAWQAYVAGSPPVGAVVVDGDGTVVARGRSRRAERHAPANQLAGSRLAHAELNALAALPTDQHAGLALYVTLEPCLLCSAAVAISHIPVVCFAGEDPMWRFVQDLPRREVALAQRWYRLEGPLQGRLASWASLLPLLERLERQPDGDRIEAFVRAMPELVQAARDLVATDTARRLRVLSMDEAMAAVWDRLPDGGVLA